MAREHERYAEDLAPYLLGALSPIEAEALEGHLRGCGHCQRDLERMRVAADALARSVEPLEPPASLRRRLTEEIARDLGPSTGDEPATAGHEQAGSGVRRTSTRSRLGRWWAGWGAGSRAGAPARGPRLLRPALLAAPAVLLALMAGLVGWYLRPADRQGQGPRTVVASVDHDRLPSAEATLALGEGGRDAVLRMTGLRNLGPEQAYELWVQRDGELAPMSLFNPTPGGTAVTGVAGGLAGIEALYVTREKAGGVRTPTENPVVRVAVRS